MATSVTHGAPASTIDHSSRQGNPTPCSDTDGVMEAPPGSEQVADVGDLVSPLHDTEARDEVALPIGGRAAYDPYDFGASGFRAMSNNVGVDAASTQVSPPNVQRRRASRPSSPDVPQSPHATLYLITVLAALVLYSDAQVGACVPGSVYMFWSGKCVKCMPGFYGPDGFDCLACPLGTTRLWL